MGAGGCLCLDGIVSSLNALEKAGRNDRNYSSRSVHVLR